MNRTLPFALISLLASPAVALAAAPSTFQDLAGQVVTILNAATFVLIGLGLVVYFWGVASNLFKAHEGYHANNLRNYLLLGVGIIFVMVSVWGIVQLLQNTLFGNGSTNATGAAQNSGSACDSFGNC